MREAEQRTRAIDKSSPVPYYHQLKEILRELVLQGDLKPGDRIDGEHALCQRYGVSRPVVRHALADLQRENVIDRVQGRGTFVAPVRTSQSLVQSLNGLYDDVKALGRQLRSEVRTFDLQPADGEIAARLQIPLESPVVLLERLRFIDDEPWVFTISHVPHDLAPDLMDQDLRTGSLYHLLQDRYGLEIASSRRVVEAHRADAALARDLQISAGSPVLKLTTVTSGADGRPIETFVAYHRADRSRFEVELTRSDRGRPPGPIVRAV